MSGALWAITAGVGFGVFQSLNRRAVYGMDVYLATFLQLLISAVVLAFITLLTVDLSLLQSAPLGALAAFGLAGLFHFFIGWTFLNLSQKQIGAARTSPLIGTTPLFGAIIAALTLREIPSLLSGVGIVLIVGGVYLVSNRTRSSAPGSETGAGRSDFLAGLRDSVPGLAAALCWSISPIFIRLGLEQVPSPLLGVTIGMIASVIAYGGPLVLRRGQSLFTSATTDALIFKVLAGVLVGLSTWMRWIALDLTTVAVVLALSLISVPVVMFLSPFIMDRQLERVSAPLLSGAGLIIGGALLLILLR